MNADHPAGSGLLTTAEAARYLTISERTLQRLWQYREISVVKVGGSVRFARDDLDAYIAKRRIQAVR